MNGTVAKRPTWFWIVGVLALLWNLLGLAMFWMQYAATPEQVAQWPAPQRELHQALPAWLWALNAVAVLAGTLGSILLLAGKRLALAVFWISLVAAVVMFAYALFPGRMLELLGAVQALPMPVLVSVIAALLVWFARRSIARGWIA
jgi:hypothetical protein